MIGISAVVMSLVVSTSPAAAATSHNVSGVVNCNGSTTYYDTTRFITATGNSLEVKLTDRTSYNWTSWGVAQSVSATYIGARVYKSNGTLVKDWPQQVWYASTTYRTIISAGNYVKDTRFKFNARMATANRGSCDNTWGGVAYY